MSATATATNPAGTLVGPAGGSWVTGNAPVWRYWVGLVAKLTVCTDCAEGGTT